MSFLCHRCEQPMDGSASCCDAGPLVIRRQDGVVASFARIPFGQEVIESRTDRALPARCHDCGAAPGGLHHLECCVQQCPACLGRLMGCQCRYEGDEDWDPTRDVGEEPAEASGRTSGGGGAVAVTGGDTVLGARFEQLLRNP
jgi:hypothetical protein